MQHELFGTKHIILIAVSVLLIILGSVFVRKLKMKTVCKSLFYIGIVSETIKIFYYIIQNEDTYEGALPKTDLPLHLCSIQILLIAIVCFFENERLKRFLLSFMMPSCLCGGIAAILIPTASARNGLWIITAQYFLYHIAITVFAIYLLANRERKFTLKDYVCCLKCLVVVMFFAIYINGALYDGKENINFMYVVGPPQSNLPYLNNDHGWLVYMVHYALLVLFCVSLCYIRPIISGIISLVKKKTKPAPDPIETEHASD